MSAFSYSRIPFFSASCLQFNFTLCLVIVATTVFLPSSAFAGLGEDVSSIQADQAHMQATLRTTQVSAYTLHELQAPTGVTLREYVSPAGKVFAVAWRGPWPPDMRQILAGYFGQYQQAAQAQLNSRSARRPFMVELPGLVVESGGHMRSFAGRAYIPEALPPGMRAETIR